MSSITDHLLRARAAQGAPLRHPLYAPCLPCKPENIPAFLRANARWAPFALVYNAERNKFDKVPRRADNVRANLSTARPEEWFPFSEALGAYQKHPTTVHGIGYLMNPPHGVVGVDLDRCSDMRGRPEPWAAEILREALRQGYYCERSPSGRGFRILYEGTVPEDWTNNERGLEVYGGHKPRFLTVTGHRVMEDML